MRSAVAIEPLETRLLLAAAVPGLYAAGTLALGVSADGSTVVGEDRGVAYRWTAAGGLQTLPQIGNFENTIASGASADGTVIVGGGHDSGGFRWTEAGGYQLLGRPDPSSTYKMGARATNADGTVIVGAVQTDSFGSSDAMLWSESGGFQRLTSLGSGKAYATSVSGDGSVVVGYRGEAGAGFASFRWTPQGGTEWLFERTDNPFHGIAYAVSADGSAIVGPSADSFGNFAARWTASGGTVNLGDLPGGDRWSEANGVNADGSVVVGSSDSSAGQQAFVWNTVHGMRSLAEVLANDYGVSTAGMALRTAYAVSGDGTVIAGQGFKNGNSVGWVALLDRPLVGPRTVVTGRHLFYNNSAYDGRNPAATLEDLAAVAPDKVPLTTVPWDIRNVSSYSRGINGVLVDFAGMPPQTLTSDDFVFMTRRGANLSNWEPARAPSEVTLLPPPVGANVARYAITWPDGAIRNCWLQVTVKANARTGLADDDVFYFGSLVAETGDGTASRVTSRDVQATRAALGSASDLSGRFDFDRDGRVGPVDLMIARASLGNTLFSPFIRAADSAAPVDSWFPERRVSYNPLLA
jgi:probable HAF family extracellular repeat protein